MQKGENDSPFLIFKPGDDMSSVVWDSPCLPADPAKLSVALDYCWSGLLIDPTVYERQKFIKKLPR